MIFRRNSSFLYQTDVMCSSVANGWSSSLLHEHVDLNQSGVTATQHPASLAWLFLAGI